MSGFAPTDRVLVSPRHLADAGTDPLRDALGPLIRLFGWSHTHDAATGHITLDSPCHGAFIDFTPSNPYGPWWRTSHHEPYWQAQFGRHTPIEAIAAFTQALPQFLGDTRHADRIPLSTNTLVECARLNGWDMTADAQATVFTSADGHCVLTHAPHADRRWQIQHRLADDADTAWFASVTQATPARLSELEADLLQRRTQAEAEGRIGEIEGIDLTLTFLRAKRDETQRRAQRPAVHLGIPARRRPQESE
ncbi:DUF317 domain-containing protein [Streptomyces sp. NPDC059517]|uniref:DUF317 domain-containing protein n=1 Tax=Streptomyces sp. NPDC059517 TaxID=3346855 RepID=UPI0036C62D8F